MFVFPSFLDLDLLDTHVITIETDAPFALQDDQTKMTIFPPDITSIGEYEVLISVMDDDTVRSGT